MNYDIDKTNWTIERMTDGTGVEGRWYVHCVLFIHAETGFFFEGEGVADTVSAAMANCLDSLVVDAKEKNAKWPITQLVAKEKNGE